MQITWPSNTRETIEDIINTIGRPVEFVTVTYSACPLCGLDPVTNTSTDSFCISCSGVYWIPMYSGTDITAHVTWKYADALNWEAGGMIFNGDGIIKIMYSGPYMSVLENTEYVVVDGKQVEISNITLLGVPQINRVQMDFKERKKEDE
jgi:hypothetical protein